MLSGSDDSDGAERPAGESIRNQSLARAFPEEQATADPVALAWNSPFVGRQRLLERALALSERTHRDRAASSVILLGEPGIGKSAFLRELARRVVEKTPDAIVLHGSCDGSVEPFHAFVGLLFRHIGVDRSRPTSEVHERLLAAMRDVLPGDRTAEVAHLLAQLVRRPFEHSPVVEPLLADPDALRQRTFLALTRWLNALSKQSPVLLCLDDLHLAAEGTIALTHFLATRLLDAPVLLFATARPELFERHPALSTSAGQFEQMSLDPLTADEGRELLARLFADDELPSSLIAATVRAQTSPRELLEALHLLAERGALDVTGSGWRVSRESEPESIPAELADILRARVALLPAPDREVLECAAICGDRFWLDSVVALLRSERLEERPDGPELEELATAGDDSRARVGRTLTQLVARDWVAELEPGGSGEDREYRFHYPQLWLAVASEIEPYRARRLHRIAAQCLELRPDGRDAHAQELAGYHLERAGDPAGAAARYRRAGDAARGHHFNNEAIRLYSRALDCLDAGDVSARLHVCHDLGSIYELTGDYEAALAAFERMLRLSWVVASRGKAAVAFNKIGRVWRRKGELELAREYLERGHSLFEEAGDERGVVSSLDDIGATLHLLGDNDEAFHVVSRGLKLREKSGDRRSTALSLANLGRIESSRGEVAAARRYHERALKLRREINDRAGALASSCDLAALSYQEGNLEDARRGYSHANEEARSIGALPYRALSAFALARIARALGDDEAAVEHLDDALTIAEDLEDRRLELSVTTARASLELARGDAVDARLLAESARRSAFEYDLPACEAEAMLTLAEASGGEEALDLGTRALSLLRRFATPFELAQALERWGRYLAAHDHADAQAHLDEAREQYRRLGSRRAETVHS